LGSGGYLILADKLAARDEVAKVGSASSVAPM
jgi:hypothetical protein